MHSMEGIKSALITVKDFTLHGPQDGKALPMGESFPRADVLQAPLSRPAEDDCPMQAADHYKNQGPSGQQQGYHQPPTSDRAHPNSQVLHISHSHGTGPQPSVLSVTGYEESTNQGSLNSLESRDSHLRFIPHAPPETLPSSRLQHHQSFDHLTSSTHVHTFRGSGRSSVHESEMLLQSGNDPLRDPLNDSFLFERVSPATVPQLTRYHPRTRTTSLVDTPFSRASGSGKIPFVSSFLRRASNPNLQRLRRGDQTPPAPLASQQGVIWPQRAASPPHSDSTSQGAPAIQKSITHSASQLYLEKSKY